MVSPRASFSVNAGALFLAAFGGHGLGCPGGDGRACWFHPEQCCPSACRQPVCVCVDVRAQLDEYLSARGLAVVGACPHAVRNDCFVVAYRVAFGRERLFPRAARAQEGMAACDGVDVAFDERAVD